MQVISPGAQIPITAIKKKIKKMYERMIMKSIRRNEKERQTGNEQWSD